MAQNDKRIQIGSLDHDVRWREAQGSFRATPGKLVVEMVPPPKSLGLLIMPETVGGNLRSDVGVVLSPRFCVRRDGLFVPSPPRGSLVCVKPYDGFWLDSPRLDGYETENQIRVYGHQCMEAGEPEVYDWWESVPCGIDPTTKMLTPFGDKIIVRPDEMENRTDGGILLPDIAQRRQATATVVSAGPLAHDIQEGDRILYDPMAVTNDRFGFDLCEETKDLWVMNADGVLMVIGNVNRECRKAVMV